MKKSSWNVIVISSEGTEIPHWNSRTKKAALLIARSIRQTMGKPMGRKVKVIPSFLGFRIFEIIDLKERNAHVASFWNETDALSFCEGNGYRFGYRKLS